MNNIISFQNTIRRWY